MLFQLIQLHGWGWMTEASTSDFWYREEIFLTQKLLFVSSQLYGRLRVLTITLNMATCFIHIGHIRHQTVTKV
jgi:hypothetical protein